MDQTFVRWAWRAMAAERGTWICFCDRGSDKPSSLIGRSLRDQLARHKNETYPEGDNTLTRFLWAPLFPQEAIPEAIDNLQKMCAELASKYPKNDTTRVSYTDCSTGQMTFSPYYVRQQSWLNEMVHKLDPAVTVTIAEYHEALKQELYAIAADCLAEPSWERVRELVYKAEERVIQNLVRAKADHEQN